MDSLMFKIIMIQKELRHARQDNRDIKLMLDKLLIDKHLQMQVDNYFGDDSEHFEETSPQTESDDKRDLD